jgi:hypothetical protein
MQVWFFTDDLCVLDMPWCGLPSCFPLLISAFFKWNSFSCNMK